MNSLTVATVESRIRNRYETRVLCQKLLADTVQLAANDPASAQWLASNEANFNSVIERITAELDVLLGQLKEVVGREGRQLTLL